jgi:hypothetical protein
MVLAVMFNQSRAGSCFVCYSINVSLGLLINIMFNQNMQFPSLPVDVDVTGLRDPVYVIVRAPPLPRGDVKTSPPLPVWWDEVN